MNALRFGLLAFFGLGACTVDPDDSGETGVVAPVAGPTLTHEPLTGPFLAGQPVLLRTTAEDPDGVATVVAYYRVTGAPTWETLQLTLTDGEWVGEVPGARVHAPRLEYVFKGTDESDFRATRYLPSDGLEAPYLVDVTAVGRALPWGENFEAGGTTVFARGFFEYSLAYAGLPWGLSTGRPFEGTWSVAHRRGVPAQAAMDDWLVSPALDLTSVASPVLTFWEYGEQTAQARHSLWISTGSPDPRQGGFELVQALPAPGEGAWTQARAVDLSTWAGQRSVHLAWRYEGAYADAWYVDDIQVAEAAPLLGLVTWRATPVEPGGEALVEVVIENRSTLAISDLSVSIEVDATQGEGGEPVVLPLLAGGASEAVSLSLSVNADFPLDTRLPFAVLAADAAGEGTSWRFERSLLVGEPAEGQLGLRLNAPTVVDVKFGRGDPASPELLVPVAAGLLPAGEHLLVADLLDHVALLPPGPGPARWFALVDAQGAGAVTSWTVVHRGVRYVSEDVGSFSAAIPARFDLPRPAEPRLVDSEVTPSPVAPGDLVEYWVEVRNDGPSTTGRTTLRLVSDDPNAVVTEHEPILLAEAGWRAGARKAARFELRVLPNKTDSQPARLQLLVEDAVERFPLDALIPVPWPVLQVIGVRVKDRADGNDNGRLDPNERAQLQLVVSNAGGRDTFAQVDCTLADAGGEAPVTVHWAEANFGRLVVGASRDEDDFDVEVIGGAPGDRLGLELACTDGTASWRVPVELALGELPWLSAGPVPDPIGDARSDYDFDLRSVRWRSDNVNLELELTSAGPFNPGSLFVEAWASSPGAPYAYYQLVSQSGSATLRGYSTITGFSRIGTPTFRVVDDRTVAITVPVASLSLVLRELKIGFAAGFCGPPTYFCDHYPDGWGDPYQAGLNTTRWVTLSW